MGAVKEALSRILSLDAALSGEAAGDRWTASTSVWAYDEPADFNELWRCKKLRAKHRAIVVWADTPLDPEVQPVVTAPHLTPYDWALAACARCKELCVTVVDLRAAQHDQDGYPTLEWLRTVRPECVPWLRRVTVSSLLEATNEETLKESLLATSSASSAAVPAVSPRDAIRLHPLCRVDLTSSASHHQIANLVGPLLLLNQIPPTASANHREALRRILEIAGHGQPVGAANEDEGPDRSNAISRLLEEHHIEGELRIVLCDDQWHHGWLAWLCERMGATEIPGAVQSARAAPSDAPREVATGRGISLWVAAGPDWLMTKLEALDARKTPLKRRLHLTVEDGDQDRNEVLLLDLRLFVGRSTEESAFRMRAIAARLLIADPDIELKAELNQAMASEAQGLSALPRLLATADPLLPILVFSSTGRRDVVNMFSGHPNIVTQFAKPRLLGDGTGELRAITEQSFDAALEEGAKLVRRRRVVRDLQGARARCVRQPRQDKFCHVGVYVDESGRAAQVGRFPFVMAGIVALYPSQAAEASFVASLGAIRDDLQRKGRPGDGESQEQAAARRADVARRVLAHAQQQGICLRGAVIGRGSGLPPRPHYGPRQDWADLALDRVHRILLKQVIAVSLTYVVCDDELVEHPTCRVLADARSVPDRDLPEGAAPHVREFGYVCSYERGVGKWHFLNQPSVYPIVDEAFSEDVRLQRFQVVGAKAVLKRSDEHGQITHPLLDWADHLAAEARPWLSVTPRRLAPWAEAALTCPGIIDTYDARTSARLLRLARMAANGLPKRALRELVEQPDSCRDSEGGLWSLGDRCRGAIIDQIEKVFM